MLQMMSLYILDTFSFLNVMMGGSGILLPPARITASKIENEALSSLLKMYGVIFICTLTCSCLDDKFVINLTIPGNFNCVDCGAKETMANTHT